MSEDDAEIRAAVEQLFAQVARSPDQEKKLPVGPASAKKLGYDSQDIESLPPSVTESFCGVGSTAQKRRVCAMTSDDQSQKLEGSNRGGMALILRLVPMVVGPQLLVGLLLFLTAGNLAWEKGWLFLLVLVTADAIIIQYIWRANPELLVARSRVRWEKRWDLIASCISLAGLLAIFPVAALDDGRFHWCPTPWWVCGLGYLLFLIGGGVLTWAGAVNKFAEPGVRIQVERGHKVIGTGPYALVRHPNYVAAVPFLAGIALSLGSLWALIPAALAMVALVLRTQWEDQTLQAEVPGYKEYTERVRFKLVPGVW